MPQYATHRSITKSRGKKACERSNDLKEEGMPQYATHRVNN